MSASSPVDTAALLFEKIAHQKAIKSKGHLPKSREDAARVLEALARRGIEQTGAWLRQPPLEQLRALVASEPQREKALTKALKATTPAERKVALDGMVRRGEAARVLRGGEVWIAAPGTDVLDDAEAKALVELSTRLGKLLRVAKAGKKGALAIDRGELATFAEELTRLRGAGRSSTGRSSTGRSSTGPSSTAPSSTAPSSTAPSSAVDVLWRLVEARPSSTLLAVPELVRASGLSSDDAKRALLALDLEGRIELRTESGIGTLSAADLALCPQGSDGYPLSYLRRKELRV